MADVGGGIDTITAPSSLLWTMIRHSCVPGAIGGNPGLGAVAGTGLVGGLVYDHVKKNEQAAYQQGCSAGKQQH